MTITGMAVLVCWLFLIPVGIGMIPAGFVDKKQNSISFMWTTGYILMWALFQVICVPLILLEQMGDSYFMYVVISFGIVSAGLAILGGVYRIGSCAAKKRNGSVCLSAENVEKDTKTGRNVWIRKAVWAAACLLIGAQLILSVTMHYADGDDAFYVAVSTLTESSETMYKLQPYSMGASELNRRHSLAPFPIWIAFLGKISGVHPMIVAHSVVSTVLILFSYVCFYQIAGILFGEKKQNIPIFLILTSFLVIFGDYSIYSVENFMIARSRQGKAALGSIVIPMILFLFLELFERIRLQQKIEWMLWVLLAAAVTAACLCTTLGTFLMCLFLGSIGLCAGIVYRRWDLILKTACCCIPAVAFAVLYFVLG